MSNTQTLVLAAAIISAGWIARPPAAGPNAPSENGRYIGYSVKPNLEPLQVLDTRTGKVCLNDFGNPLGPSEFDFDWLCDFQ